MSPRRQEAGRDRDATASPVALAEEREFLEQSIVDLEDELASGEVDERDFALLRARYAERLAAVEAAIAGLALEGAEGVEAPSAAAKSSTGARAEPERESFAPRRLSSVRRRLGKKRARLAMGIAAAVCFVLAATLLAASLAGVRLPGESATGSVTLSSAQQEQETLDRAAILGSQGQAAEAVQLYDEVLRTDPDQPDALTYGGWLVRLAGLSSKNRVVVAAGDASIAKAVKVAPGYPDAHALLAVVLYEDFARPKSAVVQFRDAALRGGSANLLASVAPIAARAFKAAGEPLPASYLEAEKAAGSSLAGG